MSETPIERAAEALVPWQYVIPVTEQTREQIARAVFESIDIDALTDEVPRVTVGSGYYATTIGYDEAREIAIAIKEWLTGRSN